MFVQLNQGNTHLEAGCTQMNTVVIGNPRNFQIMVIKLIRTSYPLKARTFARE